MRMLVAPLLLVLMAASAAQAEEITPAAAASPDVSSQISHLESLIAAQAVQLEKQQKEIDDQRTALKVQQAALDRLKLTDASMAEARAAGLPVSTVSAVAALAPAEPAPAIAQVAPAVGDQPVGQAPPQSENRIVVASLPEGASVLTPPGHWVVEPSLSFTHGSSNRLIFRGVQIVDGVLVGAIDANDADQNQSSAVLDIRYGLTSRIELEGRIPYIYRTDRFTTLSQAQQQSTQTTSLNGSDIGDVEFSARYQVNSGLDGQPVFIVGLRAKSDTGTSPYDVPRDQAGISTTKGATGSGFWGIEPSISLLYPTDPAVIYAGISYFDQLSKDINRVIGGNLYGRVSPGATMSASAGFGFALNPRFSFSLGYRHSYIAATRTEIGGVESRSTSLQVGALSLGWSLQLTPRITLSNVYEVGTTRDAPDMNVVFRLPIRF
jgi:hypothetical protein